MSLEQLLAALLLAAVGLGAGLAAALAWLVRVRRDPLVALARGARRVAIVLRSTREVSVEPVDFVTETVFKLKRGGELFVARPSDWFSLGRGRMATVVVEGTGVVNPAVMWFSGSRVGLKPNLVVDVGGGKRVEMLVAPPPEVLRQVAELERDGKAVVVHGFAATLGHDEDRRVISIEMQAAAEALANAKVRLGERHLRQLLILAMVFVMVAVGLVILYQGIVGG